MRAISLPAAFKVDVVDIAEPNPGHDEVLIELRYVGLCGSDLNSFRGLSPMVVYPRIPGHEVSGVVIATGLETPASIHEGQRVTVSPYSNCGTCPACRSGRVNACQFNQTLGVQRDGALTERIALRYDKVFASSILSEQELALVEPLSVGYHAANRGQVTSSDVVLILGCGTIGLGAVAAAADKGAMVIGLDIDDGKLNMARKMGAHQVINSAREDVSARIKDMTNGEGVHVAIEAVGLPTTARMAVDQAAFTGRVVFIGYGKDEVAFQTKLFVMKELDIRGSRNALGVMPSVIRMLEKRDRPYTELITRIYPFNETRQALTDWHAAPSKFTKILVQVK